MKMLTTQLSGLFQRISSSEEENMEETARLLAQAAGREGTVFFATFGEMKSISVNAQFAAEPFPSMKVWSPEIELTSVDRVWILTRSCYDEEAVTLAKKLSDAFIPFSALAAEPISDDNQLATLAYTYISIKLTKGLLPTEDGQRIVLPHALAGLFVYEVVKMKLNEMLIGE